MSATEKRDVNQAFIIGFNTGSSSGKADCPFVETSHQGIAWWRGWNSAIDLAIDIYIQTAPIGWDRIEA